MSDPTGPRVPSDLFDAIDPGALRIAAQHDRTHRTALLALAEVIEGGAPLEALWASIGAPEQVIDQIEPAMAQARAGLNRVRHQLRTARRRLRHGTQHRQQMQQALATLIADANDALMVRLEQVGGLLADDAPWVAAEATLDAALPLIDALEASLRDPIPGATQGEWARHQASLERAQAQLAEVPARLEEARTILAETAIIAQKMQHPLSARLWVLNAQMTEALRPAEADAAWQSALDRAVAQTDLPLIRLAGRRVQDSALKRGDTRMVTLVSHRTAQVAAQLGATDVEIIARLEQAQAAAQEDRLHDSARRMAADAVVGAEHLGDPALLARAQLMYGQLLEYIGDGVQARILLRKLMQRSKSNPIPAAILGRAALVLGNSEARHGHISRAHQDITLALQIAEEDDDIGLYDRALPALLGLLMHSEPETARDVYRNAKAYLKGTPRGDVLDAALEERFGADALARWVG